MASMLTALAQTPDKKRRFLLIFRLFAVALIVALLTLHMRSVRVFRWEHQVSGGIIVTYTITTIGMAWCAGAPGGNQCGMVLQAFICSVGAFLFALNAAVMIQRWRTANTLTRCVSELLTVLGVPLKRQVCVKVTLSAVMAAVLLIDLVLALLIHLGPPDPRNK